MVSLRCKLVVKAALVELGLKYASVELGEVDLKDEITGEQRELLTEFFTCRTGING